jgi:hypothetical protein
MLSGEATGTGSFYSLDERTTGLTRVAASGQLHARVAWRWTPVRDRPWGGEAFLRVNNMLDSVAFSQLGLPESGRHLVFGLRFEG